MSFNVYASGSGGFHFTQDNFPEGDDFEPLKILATLMSMEPTKSGVVDAVRDHYLSRDMTDAVSSIASREFLEMFKGSTDSLAMRIGKGSGWIAVSPTEKRALWADTVQFAKYDFTPGDDPGAEFFRAISQSLKKTSLNNWGVLFALTAVLSKFDQQLSASNGSAVTNLTIWLTK